MNFYFEKIVHILEEAKNQKVLVVGDVILDSYLYGHAGGVSTGIQIPIIEREFESFNLGGAANVASNIAGVSNDTTIIGRIGKDSAGKVVTDLMKEKGITFHNIKSKKTIKKQRIYVSDQQVLRIDENNIEPVNEKAIEFFLSKEIYSIIVVADYEYGMVNQDVLDVVSNYARENNSMVYFTSRRPEEFNYDKKIIIVINDNERNKVKSTGKIDNNMLFLTKGTEGMEFWNENFHVTKNTKSKIAVNVSGAGDTVLAIVSILHSMKIDPETVMYIANVAAGLAVENRATYSIDCYELIDAIYNDLVHSDYINKIVSQFEMSVVNSWKHQAKRIVFTNGCYDLLHLGHLMSFSMAKEFGDHLIVAVNSDESIKRLKGENRPINKLEDRLKTLACLEMIDMVIPFSDDTAIELIKKIQPDIYVKGEEYKNKALPEAEYAKEVRYIPMVEGVSTTYQIEKIKKKLADE